MGLDHAGYALVNENRAGSPVQADPQGTSLSTRPQVVIGVSSSAGNASDMTGYDSQLAAINEGLETTDPNYYNPALVAYNPATLDTMITTVTNAANAMYAAGACRYGDPRVIADKYEQYVQGIQGYIVELQNTYDEETEEPLLDTQTVAIVSDYDAETGKFTIVGQGATSATSADRLVEYTSKICENILDTNENIVLNDDEVSADVSASVLNSADWIISENAAVNAQLTGTNKSAHQITVSDGNILLSTERPDNLYGITMNSVENAMGLAYYAGVIYGSDDPSDTLNCGSLMRYFYSVFWHVANDELDGDDDDLLTIAMNGQVSIDNSIIIPDLIESLESDLADGEAYYDANLAD